jgi:hypothetical protein
MPLGFYGLGFVLIGLIVLWTGFRKKERWAWFVMLIILLFFVLPGDLVPVLRAVYPPYFQWSFWFQAMRAGDLLGVVVPMVILGFMVNLVALLLPIKAFFGRSENVNSRG